MSIERFNLNPEQPSDPEGYKLGSEKWQPAPEEEEAYRSSLEQAKTRQLYLDYRYGATRIPPHDWYGFFKNVESDLSRSQDPREELSRAYKVAKQIREDLQLIEETQTEGDYDRLHNPLVRMLMRELGDHQGYSKEAYKFAELELHPVDKLMDMYHYLTHGDLETARSASLEVLNQVAGDIVTFTPNPDREVKYQTYGVNASMNEPLFKLRLAGELLQTYSSRYMKDGVSEQREFVTKLAQDPTLLEGIKLTDNLYLFEEELSSIGHALSQQGNFGEALTTLSLIRTEVIKNDRLNHPPYLIPSVHYEALSNKIREDLEEAKDLPANISLTFGENRDKIHFVSAEELFLRTLSESEDSTATEIQKTHLSLIIAAARKGATPAQLTRALAGVGTKEAEILRKIWSSRSQESHHSHDEHTDNLPTPLDQIMSITGVDTKEAWKVRNEYVQESGFSEHVLHSLRGLDTPEAWQLRESAIEGAVYYGPAIDSLAGIDTPRSWQLREEAMHIPSYNDEVIRSLTGLGTYQAMELRGKILTEHPERVNELAKSLAGINVDTLRAISQSSEVPMGFDPEQELQKFREELFTNGATPDSMLVGLAGDDSYVAHRWREKLIPHAETPEAIAKSLAGTHYNRESDYARSLIEHGMIEAGLSAINGGYELAGVTSLNHLDPELNYSARSSEEDYSAQLGENSKYWAKELQIIKAELMRANKFAIEYQETPLGNRDKELRRKGWANFDEIVRLEKNQKMVQSFIENDTPFNARRFRPRKKLWDELDEIEVTLKDIAQEARSPHNKYRASNAELFARSQKRKKTLQKKLGIVDSSESEV